MALRPRAPRSPLSQPVTFIGGPHDGTADTLPDFCRPGDTITLANSAPAGPLTTTYRLEATSSGTLAARHQPERD